MQFGIQFFPTNGPDQLSAADFWGNALACVDLCDELGFSHVRTVEHYFNKYGGYSPSPIAFLSAAAMRTKQARLVTGAVLPVFSHPLKLASELCLLDALSKGRLDAGFARAFLPIEFERYGVSLDESKVRFAEAMDIITRVLREENVTHNGQYWQFPETTIFPRPTQQPHMPIWIAAVQTPESFINAGKNGYGIMAIPMTGQVMKELIALYRKSWKEAGHPGNGKVMLAFHLYCTGSAEDARAVGEPELMDYFASFANAARSWTTGTKSKDYANYDKIVEHLDKATYDGQVENCSAWIGTPDMITKQIEHYQEAVGGFEVASMQVNFRMMDQKKAHASMRLFAKEVMPRFAG